jgi:hypothetical protein
VNLDGILIIPGIPLEGVVRIHSANGVFRVVTRSDGAIVAFNVLKGPQSWQAALLACMAILQTPHSVRLSGRKRKAGRVCTASIGILVSWQESVAW